MRTASLPLPKTFHFHPHGWYRFFAFLLLLGGLCPLGIVGALLWPMISTSLPLKTIPLPLLLGELLLMLFLLIFSGNLLWIYAQMRSSKITLIQQGIIYQAGGFKFYTPWENIVRIEDALNLENFGLRQPIEKGMNKGLVLHRPATIGMHISEGMQQGVAAIELTRIMFGKKSFTLNWPFPHVLPLDQGLVGRGWQGGEFGAYLHQYAPQIFPSK